MGQTAAAERSRFPSTCWSSIFDAAGHQGACADSDGAQAVKRFLIRYLPALRKHLFYVYRLRHDQIDDLLQDFITDKILYKNILAVADPQRGRFRSFLLTVLDNYVRNKLARDAAFNTDRLGTAVQDISDVSDKSAASELFDLAWAREVLIQTMHEMKATCRTGGREDIWAVFEYRIVRPILDHEQQISYQELAGRYGFRSALQAANALTTGKRMFIRLFRTVVRQYVRDDIECDQEISDLWSILARGRVTAYDNGNHGCSWYDAGRGMNNGEVPDHDRDG